jgi:hypothetical protein
VGSAAVVHHEAQRRVLRHYIKALEDATERVGGLTKDITELIEVSTLAPLVAQLRTRGVFAFMSTLCSTPVCNAGTLTKHTTHGCIATISSVVVAAEIGDLRRFDKPGAA